MAEVKVIADQKRRVMKFLSFFKSLKLWKNSAKCSFAILGATSIIMTIAGFSFDDIFPTYKWLAKFELIMVIYILLVGLTSIFKLLSVKDGITMTINGITVSVKQGDLFKADGWKVIPFNECFDTVVDDKIISRGSLHGILIESHLTNTDDLLQTIKINDKDSNVLKPFLRDERLVYPLGRIITYKDYMLLAFSHFNEQNVAHTNKPDYVLCLMRMWKEIRRTYANKPIFLPLLGSGITSFDDIPEKSNFDLLKYMFYTLRVSGENINQQVTILLTKEVMETINLYEMKGVN